MRRIQLGLVAGSLAAMTCVLAAGCGGVVDHDDDPLPRAKGSGTQYTSGPAAEKLTAVKGEYKGVIKGVVKWGGGGPDVAAETAKLLETMSKNTDSGTCQAGGASALEKQQQSYRIGKNGNLGNVFVWITPEPRHAFAVPDEQLPKDKEVLLSQPHCAFLPHCATVFASRYVDGAQDAKGCQVLVVQNDASITHNASLKGGPRNGESNQIIPRHSGEGPPSRVRFDRLVPEKQALAIKCGVHAWMSAYVWLFDHPYHAVSSVGAELSDPKKRVWEDLDRAEVGSFELRGVPIGAKVRLFAWHEDLGHLLGPGGKEITVQAQNVEEITAKK